MRKAVSVKTYTALPDYDKCEILRYAGVRGDGDETLQALLGECLQACDGAFTYRVCYAELTKTEFFELFPPSETAKGWTENCEKIVLFAATVGLEIDRLVNRYASVSTAKALLFQAIGAERIEALCDRFCEEFSVDGGVCGRRFSPGYGDFPLTAQREIFALLQPEKHIGVTLLDSYLMSPTKSVTAVFGLKNTPCNETEEEKNCALCGKADCAFKKD